MLKKLLCAICALAAGPALAGDLTVATFNTESGSDTVPSLVAQQIKELGPLDILAVQEVQDQQALFTYTKALAEEHGGRWRYVISESGTNRSRQDDLLGIIYNTDAFRQLATTEFHMVRSKEGAGPYGEPFWSVRGVLMLRLFHYDTETEFQIATLHLKCCDAADIRAHQTEMLSAELTRSGLPTILLGDSNIPIPPDGTPLTGDNLVSLQNVTTRSGLAWAEPSNPMTTQCNSDYNSMLDQIFVPASFSDRTQAAILFPEANYCDNDPNGFADHRPIKATISDFLQTPSPAATTSAAISAAADGLDIDEIEERAQRFDRPGDVLSE